MRTLMILGAVVLLAGCQMEAPQAGPPSVNLRPDPPSAQVVPGQNRPPIVRPATPSAPDACGARSMQHLVGRPLPQPFRTTGPTRIFTSGQPVTMDYQAERLNVELSANGRVVAISCG